MIVQVMVLVGIPYSRQVLAALSGKRERLWGISSSGRASALQAEGAGFESPMLHQVSSR